MRKQKGLPRAKSRGFSLIELLIVIAVVGVIAAVAIPSLMRARMTTTAGPFKAYFGVDITSYAAAHAGSPFDQWFDEEQRVILRPLVADRIALLCNPRTSREGDGTSPSTDPSEVQERLHRLDAKRLQQRGIPTPNEQSCKEARDLAWKLRLLPPEAP